MAEQINFTSKDGNSGNYVNFEPQILPKKSTDAPNTRQVALRMSFWKDHTTKNTAGAVPMNDEMAGSSDERITGFKCNYQFTYDLTSTKNIFDQGYEYLKTLTEFAGAVDC